MMGNDRLQRQVRSQIFLSGCNSDQKFAIERRILEAYDGGVPLTDEEFDRYWLLIGSLKDSTYLSCGITPGLDETFRTTASGRNYLRTIGGKTRHRPRYACGGR